MFENLAKGVWMFFFTLCFFILLSSSSAADSGSSYSHLWGGFSTSLVNRSPEQSGNAGRAALDLTGFIIAPGAVFSFNGIVGARDTLKGYRSAPMINDRGSLSDVPGGGICQLASTIYNAALEAGLEIVERHPHSRSVSYVPPGRDATILTWRKDLKLRNPHSYPLLLRVELTQNRLTVAFWSLADKPFQVIVLTDLITVDPQAVTPRSVGPAGLTGQPGGQGFSVVTRRRLIRDEEATEELLSRDYYPPATRIVGKAEQ
jgi:vancomycin resistance protein YoaR